MTEPQFMVPLLPEARIRDALRDAKLSLSPMRARAFGVRLNTALANFTTAKISESFNAVATYKRARKLKQIESAACHPKGAVRLQELVNKNTPVTAAAMADLERVALSRGFSKKQLLSDHLSLGAVARVARRRLEIRAEHLATNRTKLGKKREARNQGDKAMRQFFGTMNGMYLTYFRRFPGVTGRTKAGKKRIARGDTKPKPQRGPYVVLIYEALHAYAWEIPNELERQIPGLRKTLRLKREAIHGYFRRTRISKLKS